MTNASHSLVQEFKLVCGKESLSHLLQSGFMFGMAFGAGFLGSLADKWGRLPTVYLSAIGAMAASTASAVAET
eukprot:CAMPEP_0181296438 /NCGR_PEP_ID=MMETSP1101-20121128/4704_1 /TAXON_ID=46948 /ORGANISM="Rhodomonas abbreviata, Strain Caron Lab Isolate" /LENGTH=72 /DNA_ID=CAMNT_0023401303 /DNA_START=129 /DNA_END=343 /DNA_ORIENTATION=-